MSHGTKSAPPSVFSEATVLLEVLEWVSHDLGSVGGGLAMRVEALRLGAPVASSPAAMEAATAAIAAVRAAMRPILHVRHSHSDTPLAAGEVQSWYVGMATLLSGLMGAGHELEASSVLANAPSFPIHPLTPSLLAQALAWRQARKAGAPLRRIAFQLSWTSTEVIVQLHDNGDAQPDTPSGWQQLAQQLASAGHITYSGSAAGFMWRLSR